MGDVREHLRRWRGRWVLLVPGPSSAGRGWAVDMHARVLSVPVAELEAPGTDASERLVVPWPVVDRWRRVVEQGHVHG
jgi:hypothetical protein